MRLSDMLGTTNTDPKHLREFVNTWFDPDDIVGLTGFASVGKQRTYSMAITAKELSEFSVDDIMNMCYFKETDNRMSMYIGVNPLKENHTVKLSSKSKNTDIERVIGLFVDFDVKEGSFKSKEDIYSFLATQELQPTLVVDNGVNGGVHAYWKVTKKDQDINTIDNGVRKGWVSHLSRQLNDVKIDRLTDLARISRMPSGIYWPKDDSRHDVVEVVQCNPENVYSAPELNLVIGDALEEYQNEISKKRKSSELFLTMNIESVSNQGGQSTYPDYFRDSDRRDSDESINERTRIIEDRLKERGIDIPPRNVFMKMALLQEKYNEMDWRDILEPHGWTYLRTQDDESREFARPGRDERSAVTDYVSPEGEVSNVMSLHSMAEETKLSDLKEAGIPLTKFRVALRLNFNDDEISMLAHHLGM